MKIAEFNQSTGKIIYRDATQEEIDTLTVEYQPTIDEQIAELKAQKEQYAYVWQEIAIGIATKKQYAKEIAEIKAINRQVEKLQESEEVDNDKTLS